jgi:hypothetical protein
VKNPRGKMAPNKRKSHVDPLPGEDEDESCWENLSSMRTTMMILVRPNLLNPCHRYVPLAGVSYFTLLLFFFENLLLSQ